MTDNLVVLLIEHKHGTNTHICASGLTAQNILYQWAQEWWDVDYLGLMIEDLGRDEAIELYFEDGLESYQIDTHMTVNTITDQVYNKESKA